MCLPNSLTETFLAARLFVDNWRWAGVPFFLRSGKRLAKRTTQIAIHFKQVPLPLFGWRNLAGHAPNILALNIQPDEGITLTFGAKAPGPINQIEPVKCTSITLRPSAASRRRRMSVCCWIA